MKFRYKLIIFLLLLIPLEAKVDQLYFSIHSGYTFIQYMYLCSLETLALVIGILIGGELK